MYARVDRGLYIRIVHVDIDNYLLHVHTACACLALACACLAKSSDSYTSVIHAVGIIIVLLHVHVERYSASFPRGARYGYHPWQRGCTLVWAMDYIQCASLRQYSFLSVGRGATMAVHLRHFAKQKKLEENEEALDDHQADLENVEQVQTELDRLNEQASDEILRVEQKYNQLRKPHFHRRSDAIEKIPDFWLQVVSCLLF